MCENVRNARNMHQTWRSKSPRLCDGACTLESHQIGGVVKICGARTQARVHLWPDLFQISGYATGSLVQ